MSKALVYVNIPVGRVLVLTSSMLGTATGAKRGAKRGGVRAVSKAEVILGVKLS